MFVHNTRRNSHHGRILRNIAEDDRSGTDPAVLANSYVAEHLRACADCRLIANRGMALALFFAGASKSHSLIHRDIVSQRNCLSNDYAHAVINEKPLSYPCSGMDFNTGTETCHLRKHPPEAVQSLLPKPMTQAVRPKSMQAGIAEQNLESRTCRGIAFKNTCYIFPHGFEKLDHGFCNSKSCLFDASRWSNPFRSGPDSAPR